MRGVHRAVEAMKRCHFCREEIPDAAIVCTHCGRELEHGFERRRADRRQAKRSHADRKTVDATGDMTWDGVERRQGDRRQAERRQAERRHTPIRLG